MNASSSASVGTFLQDVIGRDQTLEPSCGRLRLIHARILTEVETTKSELHSTVQSRWADLRQQLDSTVKLSQRIRKIDVDLAHLESQLDKDDDALRPRLLSNLKEYKDLASQHLASETYLDLLQSLHAIANATSDIQRLVDGGHLDEAAQAIHLADKLINDDTEKWKHSSQLYIDLKSRWAHLRIICQERLEDALEQAVAFLPPPVSSLTISASVASSQFNANPVGRLIEGTAGADSSNPISLSQTIISLASLSPIKRYFEPIVRSLLKQFVEPLLLPTQAAAKTIQVESHGNSTILTLVSCEESNITSRLGALHTLVAIFKQYFLNPSFPKHASEVFFGLFVPPIQQLLVEYGLQASLPKTADPTDLSAFQKLCHMLAAFELDNFSIEAQIKPVLQGWTQNAAVYWSQSIIERSFSTLRAEIATPAYWNQTETIQWEEGDNPLDAKSDGFLYSPTMSHQLVAAEPSADISQTVSLAAVNGPTMDFETEDDAWAFQDDFVEDQDQAKAVPENVNPTVQQSPAVDRDDAWGFEDDEAQVEEVGKPELSTSNGATLQVSPSTDTHSGGWDFDDEVSTSPNASSSKPHSPQDSDDWSSWNQPTTNVLPSVPTSAQPKRNRPGKLGAIRKADLDIQQKPSTPAILETSPQPLSKRPSEAMMVSARSASVIRAAEAMLSVAGAVRNPSDGAQMFQPTFIPLCNAFADTFHLYRAAMPVAHADLLSNVPSIGMQFANDCLYIARQSLKQLRSDPSFHSWPFEQAERAKSSLESLKLFGDRIIETQVNLQRQPLMDCLQETQGLRQIDEPEAFEQCQRCLKQVIVTLQRLSQAWRPVMRNSLYLESIGILVNAVLLRVLVDIEGQQDISEEASLRLKDICEMLHPLESLFEHDGEPTVALHVPVWFKFKFLSELLEASMVDIMYLFQEGHLSDYSSAELSKLIIALFADSPLRQRNLETIARGRQEVH